MEDFKKFLFVLESCGIISEAALILPPLSERKLHKCYYYNPNVYNGSSPSTEESLYPNLKDLPIAPPSAVLGFEIKVEYLLRRVLSLIYNMK
jgi:hypothetical protein